MTLVFGTRLRPEETLVFLGVRRTAEVLEAREPGPGRKVAVKALQPEMVSDADRLQSAPIESAGHRCH